MSFEGGPTTDGVETAAPSHRPTTLESMGAIRFPCPKAFDGKDENWESFAIKLRSYLATSNSKFRVLMNQAKESADEFDYDILEDDEKLLAAQLQQALVALCEGTSTKIVNRDEDCINGFETWRRLWLRYGMTKRSRATNRMTTILQWNFKFNAQEFENDFEEWETELEKYYK